MKKEEIKKREVELIRRIKKAVPEFDKMVNHMLDGKANAVIMHQDAFGVDYQEEEYLMLGMAIKYIGLSGKEIHIIGKNRETLK